LAFGKELFAESRALPSAALSKEALCRVSDFWHSAKHLTLRKARLSCSELMHMREEAKRPNNLGGKLAVVARARLVCLMIRKSTAPAQSVCVVPLVKETYGFKINFNSINELNFVQ